MYCNTGTSDAELPAFDFCVAPQLDCSTSTENRFELGCVPKGKPEAALITIAHMETVAMWPRQDEQQAPAQEPEEEGQLEMLNFSLHARRSTAA